VGGYLSLSLPSRHHKLVLDTVLGMGPLAMPLARVLIVGESSPIAIVTFHFASESRVFFRLAIYLVPVGKRPGQSYGLCTDVSETKMFVSMVNGEI
jgi:hypothetical protein